MLIRVIEWREMSTGKEKGRKVLQSGILGTDLKLGQVGFQDKSSSHLGRLTT